MVTLKTRWRAGERIIHISCGAMRQVETGSGKPERIGRTAQYYGNESLVAALESDSSLKVYGTDGTQDVPQKWEGFGEYKVVYRLRDEGLDYLGNDTVVRNYTHAYIHARTYAHMWIPTPYENDRFPAPKSELHLCRTFQPGHLEG